MNMEVDDKYISVHLVAHLDYDVNLLIQVLTELRDEDPEIGKFKIFLESNKEEKTPRIGLDVDDDAKSVILRNGNNLSWNYDRNP